MKNLTYLFALVLFAACQPNQPAQDAADTKDKVEEGTANQSVMDLFEEVNVLKMHLYSTLEDDPEGETYPYAGKQFGEDTFGFLPDGVQPNEVGGVFGTYRVENTNFYILRVPGQEVSSDLVLCKWDGAANKLRKVIDLASYRCDGQSCRQQDAWLTDLDDDRVHELVLRTADVDATGKALNEKFVVLSQDAEGNFKPSNELITSLAIEEYYRLHKMR